MSELWSKRPPVRGTPWRLAERPHLAVTPMIILVGVVMLGRRLRDVLPTDGERPMPAADVYP